jgi:hypothetical protein
MAGLVPQLEAENFEIFKKQFAAFYAPHWIQPSE